MTDRREFLSSSAIWFGAEPSISARSQRSKASPGDAARALASGLPLKLIGLEPEEMARRMLTDAATLITVIHGPHEAVAALRVFADYLERHFNHA